MMMASMTSLLVLALLAAPPDTLVVGTLADPLSLEPHRATDLLSAAIMANVCETLVRYRPDGTRPEASLATTWANVNGRVWTFTLREGVRFHDGAPLDADAVVANLENLRRERGFPGLAERVGPRVVSITLERPNAALLATLSQPFFSLQSPRELARGATGRPVGTGPFRLLQARPGLVELIPNWTYWGGPPRLGGIDFRRYRDEQSLAAALLSGEVDVSSAVGYQRLPELRASPAMTLDSKTGLNIAFLSLNNERRPLDDRRVRQAISRAIDRPALVSRFLGGHGVPARNPLPPSLWGYSARTKDLALDLPAARRLLAEAGFATGLDLTLLAVDAPRAYLPAPLAEAAQIKDDLARVGIRVTVRQVPTWAEYLETAGRGDYDMAVMGWQADTMDPNDFLSTLVASESVGTTNRSRYRSPAMDTLLKRGRRGGGPAERLTAYAEAQALFQRDMPWVPLYHVSVFVAWRREVRGLIVDSTGLLRYEKTWKAP
jgi:peptide/nickel transport system substrate-binding protein